MIKYIGFDKDGTLIDDLVTYTKLWGEITSRDFGINSKKSAQTFSNMVGQSTARQLKKVLEENNIFLSEPEIFDKSNNIAKELGEKTNGNLFPDTLKTLRKLKEN